jgi:hypothetical protein
MPVLRFKAEDVRRVVEHSIAARRLRAGGSQYMRIEHIHIESAAQAVIANVGHPNNWKGGGRDS